LRYNPGNQPRPYGPDYLTPREGKKMTILNKCPKCDSLFNVRLLTACDSVTKKIVKQPVLACEQCCIVIPYNGERLNKRLARELDRGYHSERDGSALS
jgi:hypothetical protein